MIKNIRSHKKIVFLFLIFIIFLPWFNSNYFDDIKPVELGTEDTSFYEINPCQVSLAEYINVDFQSSYQKHYFFRYNNYSPISCFGKVSGIALFNNTFSISIGTNAYVNLILQSIFWILIISFIKKDNHMVKIKYKNTSLLLTLFLFLFSIFSQKRFYEEQLYLFDLNQLRTYLLFSIAFLFVTKIFTDIFTSRMESLINYTPFLFLFIGVLSGYNITFFSIPIVFLGINSILNLRNKKINFVYLLFFIFWLSNSKNGFTFNVDKLRGFTSSSFEVSAIIFWSIFFIVLLNGLHYFYQQFSDYFNFEKFLNNYSITSITIFIFGLAVSNIPIVNFLSYYFFGQQKYGVKYTNPFLVDAMNNNEKIPWRGFYPSAESLGEFYGVLICCLFYSYLRYKKINYLNIISFLVSCFGLYFANNKTVVILVILTFTVLLFSELNLTNIIKLILILVFFFSLVFIVGFTNLTYPYEFSSVTIYEQAIKYNDPSVVSSSLNIFNQAFENQNFLFTILSFLGYISYLFNRSELWGIFIARYNPEFNGFLFGSSPLNLSQHYSEIRINEPGPLLLPHSSILSFLIYFGIIGILTILFFIFYKIYVSRRKINVFGYLLILYIFINIFKSDSLNYFSSFVLYSQLFYLTINFKNDDLFI
tara:strand:- start:2235 stop:4175 length:1941 start_codon:yes stop_codon:yes gene_type:complete